uniref:Piezo-type mechanosensitive ion channel component n=1 Tax=Parastrongyloides trichosuri TaxID=131310 RepID=A0A0N4Z7S3_PARTI
MSLIIFSACVLVMMYTYQFHGLPNLYEEYIGFTREVTESMGLRNYTPGQLIIAIMTPLSFLILALIQLNFFHASFMKRSEHWNKVMKLMRNPLVMPLRKIAKNFTITHGNSSINASKITEPSILEDQISIAESGYSQNIPPIDGKLESKGSHRYNKVKKMMTKMEKNIKTIYAQKTEFADVLWRFAEIHFDKALALILAYTIFTEISFLNIPFIIILIVFSPGHTYFDEAFKLCSVWSSVIIILKLIYQLPIINTSEFEVDCSIYRNNTLNITNDIGEENLLNILGVKKNITPVIETHITINPIDWIGLKKSDDLYNALKNYIFFLFMMALKFIVNIRQNLKRHHLKEDISFSSHLLFPGIIRRHADKNVKDCIKFLSNFFFYKFGFEITLISTAAVIAYRNDFGAFLHTIWLFPPIFIPRTRYQKISRYHTLFVGAFLIFQYVFCVGLPEISCNIYPWEDLTTNTRSRLNDWLNLPSIKYKTNAKKMFADFILYLLLCFLDRVFEEESKLGNNHPGGSNKPTVEVRGLTTIVKTLKNLKYEIKNMQEEDHLLEKTSKNKDGNQFNAPMEIPVPDFITEKGTLLDHFKEVLFIHFYWVTLAVLFLTGTSRVTLFALFYVLASFLFYWAGHSLFYLPIEYALKLFDLLIFYNNCVIFMRVILQAVGYLLIKFTDYDLCWFFQLNGIKYYNRNVEYSITGFENNYTDIGYNEACDQADNETGLFYDWLCFLFLVIQRRIFATEYFKHVIIEFKIQKVFASKGAKLIDEIRKNELDESKEFENEILNKVKFKMEKIKSRNIKENIMDNETNLNGNDDKEKASSVVVKKQSLSRHSSQGLEIEYDFDPPESPPHNKKKIQQRRKMSSPASIVKILDLGEKVSRRSSCTNISKHDVRELKKHSHMSKKRKKTSDSSSYGSSSSPIKSLEIFSVSDQKAKDDIKKLSSGEKRRKTMKRTFSINVDGPIYSFDQTDLKNIDDEECGVRGLGPLQLLNFAFKKGALKDAVKESNEIQATHDRLSKEMEDNYGISNYNLIRKAILKQKTKKVKPDFDECTFEEENDYALLGNRFSTSESVDDKKFSTVSMESGSRKVSIFGPKENVEGKEWEYIRRKTMIHLQKPSAEVGEGCISDVTSLISASDRNIFDDVGETFSVKLCDHPSNGNESPAILSELTQESFDEGEMLDKHYKKKNMSKIKYIKRRLRYFLISCKKTSKNLANFICLIAIGTIESIIAYLMFLSRDYRYVYKRLEKEKKVYRNKLNQKFSVTKNQYPMPSGNIPKIKVLISKSLSESPELSDENSKGTKDSSSLNDSDEYGYLNNSSKYKWREEYRLVRLVKAIYHLFLSRSETICYLMIFLNHMNNASLISMPLPLLALLWGTLTVPRPTKRFWTTIITYTEFLVIFKYLFQFGFFPWNNNLNVSNPFWIPRIIGIEKRKGYATYDLFLLMTLFFHRSTLITIGLWKGNNGNIEKRKKNVEEDKKSESIIDLRISKSDTQICGYNNERKENSVSVNFPTHFLDVKSLSSQSLKNKGTRALSKTLIVAQTKKATLHKKVKNELSSVQKFFKKLLDSSNRCSCDVFVPMFICDVICFLIIIFGFSGFGTGTGDGSVTAYLEQNKIPATLVSMLIIQFVLIIFDRAFFLRKFIFGKLIFQIFLVIFVHIWMFILLPAATERMFVNNLTCKLFYLTKVVYFLISAAQIRAGYPRRTLTNFGAHSYTALNLLLYKLFMLVPFLFELRSLMDWMWMDTSLGLGDWFSLHDIYSHIAMLKCERNIEEDYPSPKGVKKRPFHKYGLGGVYLVFMIFVIWFPLVLFSMANTVGVRSLPVECTLKLTVSGYQPLFESTAQLSDVRETTEEEYEKLLYIYRTSKYARNYLADYGKEDVVKTNVNGNSSMTWHISPPSREQLILDLQSNITIFLKFEWIFKRAYNDELQQFGEISDFNQIMLMPGDKIREKLTEMIIYKNSKTFDNNTTTVIEPILIEKAFPPMVVITGEGKAGPATSLLIEQLSDPYHNIQDAFFDVLLDLEHTKDGLEWWRLRMIDKNWDPIKKIEPTVKERTCIYAFVDKVFPKKFSIITGGGILGLYLSMVLFLGRFIRVQVTGAMEKIMFEELPNVDRVLQLCIDIFLVRDAGEFELEEDLYAKLVFLFRSPTTLIKWTKDKVL